MVSTQTVTEGASVKDPSGLGPIGGETKMQLKERVFCCVEVRVFMEGAMVWGHCIEDLALSSRR